ncbi:MAG: amidohydrolase family protein [Gammaproteobacteria bacterium]|nr:amidohydrolase family protein [Gammaproteobacteria bacterium]
MSKNVLTVRCLVIFALGLSACTESPQSPGELSADRIFVGDNILTMDDKFANANAVAIRGDKIIWVGDLTQWSGTATETIELGRRTLVPGFIDAHGHLAFFARTVNLANVASPPVGTVATMASLQETLRIYIREREIAPGQWVVGMGYDDSLIEEQRHPDRDDLDAVSTDHPIALIHVSGHLAAANSMALEQAGIGADTPDPAGGVIRRRPDSSVPNGVLEESATAPLRGLFMGTKGIPAEDIAQALRTYASYGITTVQDGAASWQIHQMLAEIAARNGLSLDVVVYPQAMAESFTIPDGVAVGVYHNRLKVGGVKLILDGSPQGKTAYLTSPYQVVPQGLSEDYRGYPAIPQESVNQRVERFVIERVPMLVHANGDAAAQMLIDALELASEQTPLGDHRTVMIHAQTVREDQLDRMQQLGIVPSYFSAHTFFWGDWHRDSVLGIERASRISPTASTLRRGMPFTVHNDAPIVPPDMIRLLWATVNRITRSGETLGEAQRISALEAIRAVTANAAFQYFEEHTKGSITPGKQADLVILSENPVTVLPETILEIRVVETISRGRTVYPTP